MLSRVGGCAVLVASLFAGTTAQADSPKPFSWTGFYVGLHAGYGVGNVDTHLTGNDIYSQRLLAGDASVELNDGEPVGPINTDLKGSFKGFQAGYNFQLNRSWVAGIEADYSWANIDGTGEAGFLINTGIGGEVFGNYKITEKIDKFGTVRARLAWLPTERSMMYVTGGWAWGKVQDSFDMSVTGDRVPLLAVGGFGMECGGLVTHHCFATSSSKTLNGWTLGGGTEIALTEHVTFKAEYLYVNLGTHDFKATTIAPFVTNQRPSVQIHNEIDFHTVRAGLNYKFN